MDTSVTKLLGIQIPIILAPMAGAAGGKLANAVSQAGGFGFIGTAPSSVESLQTQLDYITGKTPFGIGFIGWALDQYPFFRDTFKYALGRGPTAIWLSFGEDLQKYINEIKEFNQNSHSAPEAKPIVIFMQVNSVQEARKGAEWGVDVLVLQGIESGGHGSGTAPSTMVLLDQVLSAGIPSLPTVVSAGGINSGKQLNEVLKKGGAGVVMGTAFLCTEESLYSSAQKAAILNAKEGTTVRSEAFDEIRGTLGWPSGVDGRALRNASVAEYDAGLSSQELKRRYVARERNSEGLNGLIVWAGTGVGSIHAIEPAANVVNRIIQESQ